MTREQALLFLRKVCAERIQDLARSGAAASAEALAIHCETAFSIIKQEPDNGQLPDQS